MQQQCRQRAALVLTGFVRRVMRKWKLRWAPVLRLLRDSSFAPLPTWEQLREQNAFTSSASLNDYEQDLISEIDSLFDSGVDSKPGLADDAAFINTDELQEHAAIEIYNQLQSPRDAIELSSAVVKWLEHVDSRYRLLFAKRLEELASGRRSYALSKRLEHCSVPIFEAKLDAGQRILWTATRRDQKDTLLVWFVSKHDAVPRLLQRIEESFKKMRHPSTVEAEEVLLRKENVLIDPLVNVPMKVYAFNAGNLPMLSSGWKPPLRLTEEQQEVNECKGSVLLLGRSGTGKTVCICDNMLSDAQAAALHGVPFRQLFVCRSSRLCRFVQRCTEGTVRSDYLTLSAFLDRMCAAVGGVQPRPASCYVNFLRFQELWVRWKIPLQLSPVVVWTQIRSFITGSIEAVMQRRHLSLEQYLDTITFSSERCRLSEDQRREAYRAFELYADVKSREGLWDDGDRVMELLTRSELKPLCCCATADADYDRVYVDEVQDNTQAEIVLYLLAAGMNVNALFLAGDPAQSVVEGVDFRFEEVRSIVYTLSGGKQTIQRPVKLTVNYRSHAGNLNCARAVLDKLFAMFPGSAKVLPKDDGLTMGPCPAVQTKGSLLDILRRNEKLVVLVPDVSEVEVEGALRTSGVKNTVMGICAAKGLEFRDVVLHNFFKDIADQVQWKALLLGDAASWKPYQYPQLEAQLKLLYTAITRSCNRLIFTDDDASQVAYGAWVRWLQRESLAEVLKLSEDDSVELMTTAEWRSRGIEFALAAEDERSGELMRKAIHCFGMSGDAALVEKAECQLRMWQVVDSSRDGEQMVELVAAAL